MIDISILRTTIGTLLTDQLGTYTFSEGQTTLALRVDDGSDPYVEEPTCTGLEVVIQPELTITPEQMLAGDKRLDFTSAIVLKMWDVNQSTQAARELLLAELDSIESVAIVPRSTKLDNIEVCTLTISDSFHLFG